jgi:hypothetical protein
MPTVDVKFIANELVPGLENGKYDVEDGLSVRGLLALCENQCGASVPEKNYKYMYPLLNGKPVTLDSTITEDATLHLCRTVSGG